ncbi:MAG TPA: glycosyltransferase family 4 protein [Longimicrobiales bacterium]|nr:glycosyltransferase family 4 protein [Longimicrobiales bacterium]
METAAVLHVDAERGFSGGEVQVFLLMEGLRDRGWSQALACPPGSAAAAHARTRGFAVHEVPMRSEGDFLAAYRLARVARTTGAGLLHLHSGRATWLGGLAAAACRLPAITTRRMDYGLRPGLRTRFVYELLTRRVVAISPAVAVRLEAGGVPEDRVRTIWSAVDPARLAPGRSRAEVRDGLGAGPDDLVALAMGSLVTRKGFDVLLHAAAACGRPDLVLWIAGEGPERAGLERLAADLGVRARLLGQREDVPELLAAADLVVMPSRREGLGVAALEAMAAGRPLIASRVGGLGEAVEHERSGLLVPPGDVAGLAGALDRLAADPELRARLGAGGEERVRRTFLAERMVGAYETLYREVLAEVRR